MGSLNYQFFPRSRGVSKEIQNVIICFEEVYHKIDTDTHQLKSNEVLARITKGLINLGFSVETGKARDEKIAVPVLFGLNNSTDKSFFADALSSDGKIVVEVEAGRAVRNNQFLKDIFQACMMYEVEFLVIAVCNKYKIRSGSKEIESKDFDEVSVFLETLYVSNRLQLPLKGILLIGY